MRVVIAGGGSAGWMTAAYLSKKLPTKHYSITLIESTDIGSVGVGEATLPHLRAFNSSLGISEDEFIRSTQATFKLGIAFDGWSHSDASYIHPFGQQGEALGGIPFHHFYKAALDRGIIKDKRATFDSYSYGVNLARAKAFHKPAREGASSRFSYAYHVDSARYARFLRQYAEDRNVERMEGKIVDVTLAGSEQIGSIVLESGHAITGDLFIDCSGFRSLLLSKALQAKFTSWSDYLPCNRAYAAQTEHLDNSSIRPYSIATRRQAGWQWQIPLQHRMGNGYVFSDSFTNEESALEEFEANLGAKRITDIKKLSFEAGYYAKPWTGNCVAIGLAGGFLEPLESTSLFLIQYAVERLLEEWPSQDVMFAQSNRQRFNSDIQAEFENIRDFLVLHYRATGSDPTDTSDFWRHMQSMSLPDSLQQKLDNYQQFGVIPHSAQRLFKDESWTAVLLGQEQLDFKADSRATVIFDSELQKIIDYAASISAPDLAKIPSHTDYMRKHFSMARSL